MRQEDGAALAVDFVDDVLWRHVLRVHVLSEVEADEVVALAAEGVALADAIAEHGTKNAVSDAAVAALQLQAGFLGAKLNVLINAGLMKDRAMAREFYEKAQRLEAEFLPRVQEVYRKVHDELAEGAKKE